MSDGANIADGARVARRTRAAAADGSTRSSGVQKRQGNAETRTRRANRRVDERRVDRIRAFDEARARGRRRTPPPRKTRRVGRGCRGMSGKTKRARRDAFDARLLAASRDPSLSPTTPLQTRATRSARDSSAVIRIVIPTAVRIASTATGSAPPSAAARRARDERESRDVRRRAVRRRCQRVPRRRRRRGRRARVIPPRV